MNERPPTDDRSSADERRGGGRASRSLGSEIDLAWDEFEEAWSAGREPRIEDYLSRVDESQQWELLRALVKLEMALLEKNDQTPDTESYRQRFPQFDEQLNREFGATSHESPYGRQLGDYRLLERLGGGGMGDVYKAEHVRLHKTVALKVLAARALGDPHAIARFENEMRLIGRLEDHPNLVRASDAREEQGVHFLVMEYVDGIDLEQLVRRVGPLQHNAACELIRQAAVGLEHVHRHGLVHRDIKPSNLILNGSGRVKILDLGLARLQSSSPESTRLTRPGFALGTVDYMAPEQWDDSGAVDIRADIYSLGCTMYFLLTGSAPYSGSEVSSIKKKLLAHAAAPVPSIVERRPDCPEELDWTLRKLMAKEVDERVDVPGEVVEAVQGFASTEALKSVLTTETLDRPGTSGHTDVVTKSALTDTEEKLDRQYPPTVGRIEKQPAISGHFSRRRFVAVMAGLLFVGGAAALYLQSRPPGPHPQRADLGALPGLSGGWWFDEMPWYSPGIRRELMHALDSGETLVGKQSLPAVLDAVRENDAVEVYDDLKEVSRVLVQRLPGEAGGEGDVVRNLLNIDPAKEDEVGIRRELDSLVTSLEQREPRTATEEHLYAAVQHKRGREHWGAARNAYRSALSSYETDGENELYAVCAVDYGRLCCDEQNYREAVTWFQKSEEKRIAAAAWQVDKYCQEADAERRRGYYYQEAALENLAQARSASRSALADDHPLNAWIYERKAWAHLDSWQLSAARADFEDARRIREGLRDDESLVRVLWIRQGHAMIMHFEGHESAARAAYQALEHDIDQDLAGGSGVARQRLSKRLMSMFRQRRPNIQERLADVFLFGREPNYGEAADHLTKAVEWARDEGFAHDHRAPALEMLEYKRLLAELLAGRVEADAARQRFDRLYVPKVEPPTEMPKPLRLARQLAGFHLAVAEADDESLRKATDELVEVVERVIRNGDVGRSHLELLLLSIESLAKSEQLGDRRHEVGKWLAAATEKTGRRDGQMANYLRRYLDLADPDH
ncbi:MAG: serine/threonine protein kinase [Planctomycetota bacterium]|nr:MAG: serine/threonine protein kinase [Planctomycetota bacterium]REK37937.1 MAG: serine/threonine protein kinase [Planctomycetota bacterium]